jgi:hypothetical protein
MMVDIVEDIFCRCYKIVTMTNCRSSMYIVECRIVQFFKQMTLISEQITHPNGLLFLVTIIPLGAYLG